MPLVFAALALGFTAPDRFFDVQPIARDVYAVIRKEPAGLSVDCNVVFIVNERDVVVVDANIGPESARATLGALRKITRKPVRYVIGTHYHDDHIGGYPVYRAAFPGVEFIGHTGTPEALRTLAAPSRKQMIEIAPRMVKMLQTLIEKKQSFNGGPLSEEEKTAYESDIRLANRYARELPKVEIIPPTIEISDQMTIQRPGRTIQILHLGKGHTPTDLVVYLPRERIAVVGDLVVAPIPLVGSNQSSVDEWPRTLDRMLALNPAIVVPGHGPVMRELTYIRTLSAMFTDVTVEAKTSVARGESLADAQKRITLDKYRSAMNASTGIRKTLFDNYVLEPSIAAAYAAAKKG